MAHIDRVLDLKKDTFFNARVNDCSWDASAGRWTVKTLQGHKAVAKYLILGTGLLHRTYTPAFEGLKDFKGELYHSGDWDDSFNAKGKKLAVIGAGSTAVQITQELGKQADDLTVFVRRPSYCLPLRQRAWTEEEQIQWKAYYPTIFNASRNSATGWPCERMKENLSDVSLERREQVFDTLWRRGGFQYLRAGFKDTLINKDANKVSFADKWNGQVPFVYRHSRSSTTTGEGEFANDSLIQANKPSWPLRRRRISKFPQSMSSSEPFTDLVCALASVPSDHLLRMVRKTCSDL